MFYNLEGILVHIEPCIAVISCGGVGFQCNVSMNTMRMLPKVGEKASLFTKLNVRQDAINLFGFISISERNCFKMLTNVSCVGPKAALAILSELTPEQLAIAVASGDSKALTRAVGVGLKLAQRVTLELRDKVEKIAKSEGATISFTVAGSSAPSHAAEAVNALGVLGYFPTDAASVVAKFDSSLTVEELIRLALKDLGSKL